MRAQLSQTTVKRDLRGPAVLCLLALALPARAGVVLLPIGGEGAAVDSELRDALSSIPSVSIQPQAITAESLAAADALGLSCDVSAPACMAEMGGLASGELVVGGSVELVPDGSLVQLHLVEVASTAVRRSAALRVPAALGEPRRRALRQLAVRLLAPEQERGRLVVRCRPHGAVIQIDGDVRGTAPLPAPIELALGDHDVYVALPRHLSARHTVEVHFDTVTYIEVDLVRDGLADDAASGDALVGSQPEPSVGWWPNRRVAITSIDARGVDVEHAREIADALTQEVGRLKGTTVVRVGDVPGLLEPATALLLACHEPGCHQLVAGELEADTLLQVEIGVDGDERYLAVRRIDGSSGLPLSSERRSMRRDGADRVAVAALVVRNAFADRQPGLGEVRAASDRSGLPPWVFFSTLAGTGVAAGAAGGLLLWSSLEEDGPTRDVLQLSLWLTLGATAALTATDVAIGFTTDW